MLAIRHSVSLPSIHLNPSRLRHPFPLRYVLAQKRLEVTAADGPRCDALPDPDVSNLRVSHSLPNLRIKLIDDFARSAHRSHQSKPDAGFESMCASFRDRWHVWRCGRPLQSAG